MGECEGIVGRFTVLWIYGRVTRLLNEAGGADEAYLR